MSESPASYTVSNYILDRLRELGLRCLFAVPGDYASTFLLTLDGDPDIKRIPNINELGVGYAADGYARFKGIGACSVQYGVGTFSILNCIAGSYVERVPVVLLGPSPSAKDRELTRTEGILFHHSTGNLKADKIVLENVTVASVIVSDGGNAPSQIDSALVAMLTHRRPVYIEVWQNVWGATCAHPHGRLEPRPTPSYPPSLEAALDSAWNRIVNAKLPILWAGVEIQRFGLQDLLQQIVDASGFYFTTTSLAKTVLDERQRPFIGTYAGSASPALTRAVMTAADCIVALGTIITDDYLDIMASSYGAMIEVTDEQARVGYERFQGVVMEDFMKGLLQRFRSASVFPRVYKLPAAESEARPALAPTDALTYQRFYYVLSDWLLDGSNSENIKLILGESTSLYVFGNLFTLPKDSFVAQAAWGSLGHETGCALGVELATGKRPIVVAGDGGFMMVCQEISSLARQKSNAIVFVMSNGGYAIEQAFVDISAFKPQGSYAPFDLLPGWDYIALAKAFGAKGFSVSTVGELRELLIRLNHLDGVPSLVEVKIPLKDIPPQLYRLATTP